MKLLSAKERIFKNIRQALKQTVPLPFPDEKENTKIFPESKEDLSVLFAETFIALQGKFIYCSNSADLKLQLSNLALVNKWPAIYCKETNLKTCITDAEIALTEDLANCAVSLTSCEFLIARTGSMLLSSAQNNGRTASVYAPVHICVAFGSQLVFDVADGLKALGQKYAENYPSFVTLASGPSRTADIEKTLVTGVHGPKEVYCFLVDD